MATIKMTIEIEVDNDIYNLKDKQERLWLENEIFVGDGSLLLHSNEIGDTVGEVKKVSSVQWLFENDR